MLPDRLGSAGKGTRHFMNKSVFKRRFPLCLPSGFLLCAVVFYTATPAFAQTNVVTQHNDIARTGANTNETVLTPSNVNTNTFGKLFSSPVDGFVYAQPLYMSGVTLGSGTPQAGTKHNMIFVATEHDSVYAFDADSNLGANAQPLWQITLLDAAHGVPSGVSATTMPSSDVSTTDIIPEIGITSTGVIDPSTNTLYIVGKTKETSGTTVSYVQRLHALDITTGAEKLGGPMTLQAAIAGFGSDSSGGILNFDPLWENNRAALLLLNGIVYIPFGSHGDNGPWHGWILAYNASTLKQTGAWCTTPNGIGAGIWMSGSGLAADVPDPAGHPFGRILTATGNGDFNATPSYTNAMNYGDSIVTLDLTNGAPSIVDDFTAHDQATLDNGDEDLGSGGVLLLPDSVGGGNHVLTQVGKTGRIYVLNQDNLGGYNANNTKDPGEAAYVNSLWGSPAYWNGNVYVWATSDNLKAFSISNGVLSSTYTSASNESAGQYSPSPSISANGNTNGIVWSLRTDNYNTNGREILYAHDATNVANLLYSSESNVARDNPGNSVKFIVPTIANGKVYAGSQSQVSVFGLLNALTQAATPVINPASQSFSSSLQVTITDSTAGATIYYTTDGSQPTTTSTVYSGPFNITSTTTVNAMAAGSGLLQSSVTTATYTLTSQVATPTLNPPPGAYNSAQSVAISTTTSNATIFYTTDGTTPATSAGGSTQQYTGPISVATTETLKAIATAPNLSASPVAGGFYSINLGAVNSINFSSGFTAGNMALLGKAKLNGTALELTDGGANEASAAWFNVQANVQNFSTDFTFLVTPGASYTADGFTFTIQANNATAIGPAGGGLGYGPDSPTGTGPSIPNSVAIKFDLFNNAGEGSDSTGLYTNGQSPTTPSVDMTSSGINLHSGDQLHAHITYDGANLALAITDLSTNATFTHSWPIDIPTTIGETAAYIGFTGGTGGDTATQQILNWTYTASGASQPTLTAIAVTPANPSATAGSTLQFHATGTYSDNSTQDLTASVSWASSNTSAATINTSGLASAVATGTSTISAASGSISGSTTLTVTQATLKSIAVTPANPSAVAGSTLQFHATGTYSDNSTQDLTSSASWASSNTSAATISASGLATAVAAGTSTISAVSGSISGSTTLTVTQVTLKSIAVTPANPSAVAGSTLQFHATGTYSDNSTQDLTSSVSWASSNTSAATINASGLASAVAAGTSTISAASGSISGSTTLTVTQATLKSVAVTPANPSSAAGSTAQFHATGTYSDNSTKDLTSSVTWTSSNTSAATINASGLATAVAAGTSTISAASGSISGSTTLTVTSGSSATINYGSGFSSTGLALNGNAALNGTRLRLTNGGANQASSAWFASPVNVQTFTTNFTFQLTPGASYTADGFTFTIQGTGSTAIGPAGGGLGYGPDSPTGTATGITKSVAVKFDLFNNAGEGSNSTGLYVNAASPTTPAVALGGGVNLHSGDIFHVNMSYDGTTLTMTITDTANTALTFTTSWTIDIPGTVGSSTALVGFTAGTGGDTSTQDILTWTY